MATLNRSDLDFLLQQILIAEAHTAGADLTTLLPNSFSPLGLRTVDGSFNNLMPAQGDFGSADQPFARLVNPVFPAGYAAAGNVTDATPRVISNLIADMTSNNPAAAQAFVDAGLGSFDLNGNLLDANGVPVPPNTLLTIPNAAPDAGLSAPFNSWFTFFGQFFDHGLDLVNKVRTENVFIPLQEDDPLFNPLSPQTNFMVVSRTVRDADGEQTNQTTPFVDQNQTYTSHASHQVFLREYATDPVTLRTVATGRLLDHADGGLATWADVKAQARSMLGIDLSDADVLNVPLLRTDAYGKFIPNGAGFAQIITGAGVDNILNTADDVVVSGTSAAPIAVPVLAARTGHAFLDDIAHSASPLNSQTGALLAADGDTTLGNAPAAGTYDNELLDRHFITGDGRGNENIALTAVHHVFHSEHNRQVDEIKATILASGDVALLNQWLDAPVATIPADPNTLNWNGERMFQAAKFATEMQYQHLVFEEFARKVQPAIDAFLPDTNYDTTINPAIFAEFAHAVYRLGHSMLTEVVSRLDPSFNSLEDDPLTVGTEEMALIDAFLNPVGFNSDGNGGTLTPEEAAGAVVRGMTRQTGNAIDEFVTEAVRNNLLGLPLDLAAINIARGRDTGIPTLNAARREFYESTQDSQLKPYANWNDFALNLKHADSVVNFMAAYGTHATIAAATSMADKRAAAVALVFGDASIPEADRQAFLTGTGIYAATLGGVENIDLWIGGLAEKTMPFGGMLGSTFNFVFETQMENLQNGDRFYYLARLQGMHFLAEMENNTFAKLVMANTDATHLPADIFSNPGFILEVDATQQHTGLGDGNDDPTEGGTALVPIVIRDNPATAGADNNYLRYTGEDHVVLGGTAGNDILIASIGDDTIYGDGGNDRIEGGDGNDHVFGGLGDDIITDRGGDDVIKGDEGNDVIQGGQGANLIIAGQGKDFVITGEDISEVFAGEGDDFVLGSKANLPTLGNEGNDWIELGTQDGTSGDSADSLGGDAVTGHDVLISGGGFDELIGEGGDDIFSGSDGEDHFDGGSGFDWAIYKFDPYGVTADMKVNDFIEFPATPSSAGIFDRFAFTEGLSGSAFADFLRGDDADTTEILQAGSRGSVLTAEGIARIANLASVLPEGTTSFSAGNIILGGEGSDVIEGRGGNDIIDGDAWLNVRVQVTGHPTITSVDSIKDLVPYMLSGEINPGQLSIVREVLTSATPDFDTAFYAGPRANYTVSTGLDGVTTVTDNVGLEGTDTLRNIERLQFGDQAVVLAPPGTNNAPVGVLVLSDTTPVVNGIVTIISAGITDADNAGGGLGNRPVSYVWQYEPDPVNEPGVFADIIGLGGDRPATAGGTSLLVTPDLSGFALRARAVYKDDDGVLENVFSAASQPVTGSAVVTPPPAVIVDTPVASDGVRFIRGDLDFILEQIKISERHANGEDLNDILPNSRVPFGMRTVDGSLNNLVQGQEGFGAADTLFPRLLDPAFRPGYDTPGNVTDQEPRIISNLIVDQTANNPATAGLGVSITSPGRDGLFGTADDTEVQFIPNSAPDEGLSAPFNAWMTFFGQFFDHGLDLVDKGGSGTIFAPLLPTDPLYNPASPGTNFLMLTRATNQPGADGVLGTADDVQEHTNGTTPFIDQNQTYTSHASHQVFLREYAMNASNDPVATGRLITNHALNADGTLGAETGGMATWAVVKAQARQFLGIELSDYDIVNVPLLRTDAYGKFIPNPATGFAQIITGAGADGLLNTADDTVVSGTAGAPVSVPVGAARTGHGFLDDIAHFANPFNSQTGAPLLADAGNVAGNVPAPGTYDDELLDAHYMAGDGRANENIALTAVHHVFHSEHNRLVEQVKATAIASNDVAFLNQWLLTPVTALPTTPTQVAALNWNGEYLFQAARFGTEMQYQHLVFEEFARKIQPNIDIFFAATQVYDTAIDPSIVAEFAHTVYRFGHSMLTETVDRFDANFNVVGDGNPTEAGNQQLGLIRAFLNPLEFAASGVTADEAAGALVRGLTREQGNQIDEFVTEALRNNLLGLPLDLATINILRGRDTGVPSLNAARRDFYEGTGDSQLKPYTSWVDLVSNLKNPASLVNFIAAYGTHATIEAATDVGAKRQAALNLLLGNPLLTGADATAFNLDRLAFLNSTGSYANGPTGVTTTGVDAIDLWIGGLAEKNMPFGGMLGSTFNFVFEEQMEKLQDGDRFYYLERTQGLNFLTELENNSFARLIMANTDATHLPGDVFSTPGFTLELDATKQFTGLAPNGRGDPEGDVIRDNPATSGSDTNYLRYTGDQHVVLGGTAGNDILIASEGDDTLHGDAGNDRLEGGFGNDFVLGGAGDDIMTDGGGDDNMQGADGNDAIHGGNGLNLILGGFGNDFIVTGEDPSEAFGGPGNDFILGARGNEFVFGNEGDDWIQFGMADGSAGENFDALARDQATGNDVFIGNTVSDRMDGEAGDDIMFGNGGQVDRYEGGSGFDWAGFKDDPYGVTADLLLRAFDETPVPVSNATVLARFTSTEGMSGSDFADILRGDDNTAVEAALSGTTGSILHNTGLISGLQTLLNTATGETTTSWAGNIILGGGGSDLMEGRGGNDIIDGDSALNVRISVRANPNGTGAQVATFDSMEELAPLIFNGTYNPGQLTIVREIVAGDSTDFDTVYFNGNLADYDVELGAVIGTAVVTRLADGAPDLDDRDYVVNVERLQFNDQAVLIDFSNDSPGGAPVISSATPAEDQELTVSAAGITDGDNISAANPTGAISGGPISYFWQAETRPGVWEDILIENAGGEVARATGTSFTPRGFEVGLALRVMVVYKDANDVLETVFSEATAPVGSNNSLPVGVLRVSDTTPTETLALTAIPEILDADGLPDPGTFTFQWQQSAPGGGGVFTDIAGATTSGFTPGQDQVNRQLQVVMRYTDLQGHPEVVTSAATVVTGDFIAANAAAETLNGNAGQDLIFGGGGIDIINGNAEDDFLDGGAGADTINGGAGNDTMLGQGGGDTMNGGDGNDTMTGGDGADSVSGQGGDDTFVATATDGNDSYNGGGGTDTYDLSGTAVGMTVTTTSATGGGQTDTLAAIENVIGSQGNDSITLNGGANVIDGQAGNDTIDSGAGSDTVTGGLGDDTITGGAGADALSGGEGNDTFNYTIGDGNDTIDGGDGDGDRMNITGGAGSQTLAVVLAGSAIASVANSSLSGIELFSANLGAGVDTLNYGATTSVVEVDLVAGLATGFESISNIENVSSGSGADILIGGAGANALDAGAGDDRLTGGAGADSLAGAGGNDTFIATLNDGNDAYNGGGGGDDTYDLSAITVNTTVNLAAGNSTSTQTGTDTLAQIEHAIGGSAVDTMTGSNQADTFDGRGGNDVINAGGGADVLLGGAGNDSLVGGAGADVLEGGLDADTVNGGDGADRLVATTGDGADVYTGGAGEDTYDLSATDAGATVTAIAASSAVTGADTLNTIENIVGSQGNDSITLAAGANVVDGQAGDDTINTGAGNDRLIGGAGNDTMDGGIDNDIFVFQPGFGEDRITGFDAVPAGGQDRLDISALGITAPSFGTAVLINAADVDLDGAVDDTLVAIFGTTDTIGLLNTAAGTVTQADFIL